MNSAFSAGERLTYKISWSKILKAGTAVMEVREDRSAEGKDLLLLVSAARSAGLVSAFYKVSDTIVSVVERDQLRTVSYHADQKHGKRRKQVEMKFDHGASVVRVKRDGLSRTFEAPFNVMDALSSLYYIRTRDDLSPEKPLVIDVFDGEKSWDVEIRLLGRERLRTDLGEFDTIRVATYPKYEGVFMHKGEIHIWLTDDERRIPLMMKSTISIGSIVATLTDMKGCNQAP